MTDKICVALLAGGRSGEREVSLKGATEVAKALDPEKYRVLRYDPATDLGLLASTAHEIDVAFILLHGLLGEDGTMQGFLDQLGIPYQGSGVLGSAMAMDKNVAKIIYRHAGLPVPEWVMVSRGDSSSTGEMIECLGLPLVIKPLRQGSSLGISIATTEAELIAGLAEAFCYDDRVMVEKFIKGREITVGVMGNDSLIALPLVEIIPSSDHVFFDYTAKYDPHAATSEVCPAEFPDEITSRAQEYGLIAHRALMLRGYSRTDMIVNEHGIFILETNTIPGMTPTSLLPQAAKVYGLSFSRLLDRLLELALDKGAGELP
ncbi:MAG: D-alanine--D-alanine ligase [Proteobacteria bacterium]|nr:D-alanine--D-alanine ligase [Pseudomonadota bacterium]MBU1687181.1 D-alanine--D-alanine ligase [Pseudomonadota bacterium]